MTDTTIMRLALERDKLRADNEALRRKLIMYTPEGIRTVGAAYDRLVAERNELEEQLRGAKEVIETLCQHQN